MSCPPLETDLTDEEALAVLDPYFCAVQEQFRKKAKRVSRVTLEIAPWVRDSPRHFAGCSESGTPIVAAPELAELPEETVLAIFAHEFGHAVDFLYPAQFAMTEEGELIRLPDVPDGKLDARGAEHHVARMRQWRARDADLVERTADAIAEEITMRTIGYCGPCHLQCFDRGRPRPVGLR